MDLSIAIRRTASSAPGGDAGARPGRASVPAIPADRRRVRLQNLAAVTCAAGAGVHAALVPDHFGESAALGIAFVVSTVLLAVAALAIRPPRHRWPVPVAVAVLLAGTALAYLLSRTSGIPWLITDPEEVDPLGVTISAVEVVGAFAALLSLPTRHRKARP
jgi:uncharacterized membrane protein (UPF0136 family)